IADVAGAVLVGASRRNRQRAASQGVVRTTTGGCATGDSVVDRDGSARRGGKRNGEIGRGNGLGAAGTRRSEGNGGRIVVVGNRAGAGAVRDSRVNRVAQVDRESFVYLVSVVAVDG